MRPVRRMILLCALAISVAACAIDTPLLPEPASGTVAASATSVLESGIREQEPARKATAEAAMDSNVGAGARADTVSEAMSDARSRAQELAQLANIELGPVLSISEIIGGMCPPVMSA